MLRRFGMSKQSRYRLESDETKSYNARRKRKSLPRVRAIKIFACLIVFVLLIYGGWEARRFFPYPSGLARIGVTNWQTWEFHNYFNLDPSVTSLIIDGTRITGLDFAPHHTNDHIYLPVSFVREHIDPFMFWDEGAGSVFVSDENSVTQLFPSPNMPVIMYQSKPWIEVAWLQIQYPHYLIEHHDRYNVLVIANTKNPIGRAAEAVDTTTVRYLPAKTAFITQIIEEGASLDTFYEVGEFIRVRTSDGLLGYAASENISFTEAPLIVNEPDAPARLPAINLAWELITVPAANANAMGRPLPESLTVISPTWFSFNPYTLDGEIISLASREYVNWAHYNNVEVWAHIFDTNPTISRAILTSYLARERAITQLLDFVVNYNLDGINVNFEYVPSDVGDYYLQFLRELAPGMRRLGATLSVATFVPAPWRSQYHHHLVGQTVDFVAIMTYDEHVGASDVPGPVASLPFVDHFVRESLELIPREKLLMGLPLYNRVWRVLPDGSHTASAYGFARPWALVEEWGVTPTWDPVIGSYYANFVSDEATYSIWIECERSISEKLNIFTEHELAGVASWRRSLETEGVWDIIANSLN